MTALLLAAPAASATGRTEMVVTLDGPSLADAKASSRVLTARARAARLDLRAPASTSYLRGVESAQRRLERRIRLAIPAARVHWRYRVVLNAIAVTLPPDQVGRLTRVVGARHVLRSVAYRPTLDRSPRQIGATSLWGSDFSTAGNGVKIGIIDEGVDQTHPFFDPSGFTAPPGFPKGQRAYTTAKVIVARAFPPPGTTYRNASKPFDPRQSEHGTHVAGIAAGDFGVTVPTAGQPHISGVAPNAYLGNYKALTVPTDAGVGLDGNSPEIAAAIEAAVRDGMDVINLSLGEPEIEPSRDLVVQAINGAAAAGVVPTVAAGNDFAELGFGTVGSPGNASGAITAAAVTTSRSGVAGVVASFSSAGPTPVSLALKPDVSAPGSQILSSLPSREGLYGTLSGTSMAAPHVAGAAALLRQRHPAWSVAQIKSALVLTAEPAFTTGSRGREAPTTREGGGQIFLPRADDPLVFALPSSLSFGLVRPKATGPATFSRSVTLVDAGGGAGPWNIAVQQQKAEPGVSITVPASTTVPGRLDVSLSVAPGAQARELTGFVVLTLGTQRRRIPYWLAVERPRLHEEPQRLLVRTGTYDGTTQGKPSLVSSYRYPVGGAGVGVRTDLRGPEQVFRFRVRGRPANFGAAVVDRAPGVHVHPRIVVGGDENRLLGYGGLPVNLNPYLRAFLTPQAIVAAIRPAPGTYNVVFDTPSAAQAGSFRFRFWVNDTSPPRLRLLGVAARTVTVRASDAGSGVDPASVVATVDDRTPDVRYDAATSRLVIDVSGLRRGAHRLALQVSDRQEAKNMEDVPQILPNTARLRATFRLAAAARD